MFSIVAIKYASPVSVTFIAVPENLNKLLFLV